MAHESNRWCKQSHLLTGPAELLSAPSLYDLCLLLSHKQWNNAAHIPSWLAASPGVWSESILSHYAIHRSRLLVERAVFSPCLRTSRCSTGSSRRWRCWIQAWGLLAWRESLIGNWGHLIVPLGKIKLHSSCPRCLYMSKIYTRELLLKLTLVTCYHNVIELLQCI